MRSTASTSTPRWTWCAFSLLPCTALIGWGEGLRLAVNVDQTHPAWHVLQVLGPGAQLNRLMSIFW